MAVELDLASLELVPVNGHHCRCCLNHVPAPKFLVKTGVDGGFATLCPTGYVNFRGICDRLDSANELLPRRRDDNPYLYELAVRGRE